MLKSILIPLTGADIDRVSLPAALTVARQYSAHLDFLYVRPDMAQLMARFGDVGAAHLPAGLFAKMEQAEINREAAAKQAAEEFCKREHVTIAGAAPALQAVSARWFAEVGDRVDWVARYGQTAELIVSGRREANEDSAIDLIEAALLDSGRPVYIPGPVPVVANTVAIAWKPTREAARAVAGAAPFLAQAKRVVVITVREGGADDLESTKRLVTTLQRHHLAVEAHHLEPEGRTPVDRLLIQAIGIGAGLLVMGGYGHSRLREWIFGGFTEHVLRQAPLPILMSH
jgi:nucleotide-binding universal stress UspA family protein